MKALIVPLLVMSAPSSAAAEDRILTLGGAVTETVFALGRGALVVAVDQTSQYPAEARALPNLGFLPALSPEGLLAQRPTLLLTVDGAGPPEVLSALRAAQVRIERLSSEKSIAGAKARIQRLGEILGRHKEAQALLQTLDAELAGAKATVAHLEQAPRVLFIYAQGAGTAQVAGRGTGAAAIIELAGGSLATPEFENYRPVSAEGLLAAQPELILLTSRGLGLVGGIDGVLKLPGVQETPAGRARRILAIEDNLLLSFGPRTGEAVQALAKALAEVGKQP